MTDKTLPTQTAQNWKRPLRFFLGAATLVFFASCQTSHPRYNHWNFSGLTPRLAYHFLSYDTEGGIPYYEHASNQRSDINMTLRRHLLGYNPENPFQNENVWIPSQPHFSPLPNPFNFFHLSSVVFGSALLGAGGGFILFPIEVIPVMLEEGGPTELASGFREFPAWYRHIVHGEPLPVRFPPPVDEFQVKNR